MFAMLNYECVTVSKIVWYAMCSVQCVVLNVQVQLHVHFHVHMQCVVCSVKYAVSSVLPETGE